MHFHNNGPFMCPTSSQEDPCTEKRHVLYSVSNISPPQGRSKWTPYCYLDESFAQQWLSRMMHKSPGRPGHWILPCALFNAQLLPPGKVKIDPLLSFRWGIRITMDQSHDPQVPRDTLHWIQAPPFFSVLSPLPHRKVEMDALLLFGFGCYIAMVYSRDPHVPRETWALNKAICSIQCPASSPPSSLGRLKWTPCCY